jgi:1-deoxy-D-xylulose-5-phosphate reductoisomerase
MDGLAVLGATGTIGLNTLEVAARHPQQFRIVALTANRDSARLAALCETHRPDFAVIGDATQAATLRSRLREAGLKTEVLAGSDGLCEVVSRPEVTRVMAGIVGAAGLVPTLAAVRAGKCVMLANKEPLVMAGALFMAEVARCGATLLPVDSEHNAIFQCLPADYRCGKAPHGVRRILLTASGGPFRDMPLERLRSVTPEQAVRHPNWVMGPKISVDSATMMNKGLELIEAASLFGMDAAHIEIMLHPQSVVHSLVEFADGSVLAQLGQPDMRTPIACALAWPARIDSGVPPLDLCAVGRLDFRPMDPARYPCLALAQNALSSGGSVPAVLNAANEIAVEAFLSKRLAFTGIADVIAHCLDAIAASPLGGRAAGGLDEVLAVDEWARSEARQFLSREDNRYAHV